MIPQWRWFFAALAERFVTLPRSELQVWSELDQTIANLGRLSREGMLDTDIEIINIMRAKQQGKHQ